MKKILLRFFTFFAFIPLVSMLNNSFGQVNYNETFGASAGGWTGYSYFTGATACGGSGGALRYNQYFAGTVNLVSPSLGTSTGGQIQLSYDYKIANWSANTTGTPNPWGSFIVEYGATSTGPWTTIPGSTVDQTNHVVSGNCATKTISFTPPAGALFIRFSSTWSSGDYYLNFDNILVQEAPPAPPTPTQAGGTPTCASGTTIDVVGTPPANTTWYWQTTAAGTSTSAPYAGPYAVSANGTYYLRAFNSVTSLWSAASSVTVSNFPTESTPPAPTPGQNPACNSTTVTAGTPPANVTYYWQSIASGTSTANSAATPLPVSTNSTVYLSAYNSVTQCWSGTSSVSISIDTYVPQTPISTSNPLYLCTGATTGVVNASQAATSGADTIYIATPLNLAAGATIVLPGTINIPAGATVTSSQLSFMHVTTTSGSWPSDIMVSMNGAATLSSQVMNSWVGSVTNAGPYNLTPSVTSGGAFNLNVNHTYSFGGPLTVDTIRLIVNYTVPASTISWYSAATGGSALATNSPTFESVGSTIITNPATAGTYHVYAAAVTGGCQSTRLDIVVNVTPVNVVLAPVHVTCNGMNNGSFTQTSAACGTGPFTYSVDASPFGAIPTNLTPGNHTIIVQDAAMGQSAPIVITINEPLAPQNLTAFNTTFYQTMVTWTPQGNETSWVIEWGPVGFTPGTGTIQNASNDTVQIYGLAPDTDYDFYVQAGCVSSSDWGGPETFATDVPFLAWDNQCGPGFTDISTTGTALNLADDASTVITTVNPVSFQGVTTNSITVSNNGWIGFGAVTLNAWNIDLDDEFGNVYWQETTIGGDNYLIVEWHDRPRFVSVAGQLVTFEIAINQTTGEVYYLYSDKVFGGSQAAYDYAGSFALISAVGPMSTITVSNNSQTYLQNNSCVHFYNALCPNVQNMVTLTYTEDAQLNWDAGMYGETNWTVVYGLDGFDPSVPGQAIDTLYLTTSDVNFGGTLTQLTCYDAYIYSECQADSLTSDGFLVNFCTKPYCSDITALTGQTDPDSLELTWNWMESSPIYPVTGFNIQYGMNGFAVGSGTIVDASGINFADTIFDATLLGSGVYQVYVQAECSGTNDTSNWVGPISVIMTPTNDIVCNQEGLMMNTQYTFNTTNATVSLNEVNIAPPATGAQTTTGWVNSTLNGTLWYTFVAPPSGQVRINSTAINFNSQSAVYTATNCGDFNTFTLIAANDDAIGGTSTAPNYTVCGLTPGNTYYLMYDKFTGTNGNFGVYLSEIVLNAGLTNPVTDVCYGDTVNLFTTINGYETGGAWTAPIAAVNASITDSTFTTGGLAYTTFDFEYRVVDGCAFDTVVSQIHIFGPSNAGQDGTITACRNQPIDLLAGLNGNADLNGTWYDPANVMLASSSITTANFPGQYNYDYISGNGVCPDDTANVVVTVTNCNFLSLEETVFEGVSVYPNPTTGVVFVEAAFENGSFSAEVTDVNGRLIAIKNAAITAQNNSINLTGVERGTYFIKLSKDNVEKVFRIVVQ